MASFAEIDTTSYVLQVIVLDNADVDYLPFPESEPLGQAFIAALGIEGTWLQTSKSGAFRGTYAGIGWFFDETLGEYGEFVDLEHQMPIV